MNLITDFIAWVKSAPLWGFRASRHIFYRDLSRAIDKNEGLMEFLSGELTNTKIDRNEGRARALKMMLKHLTTGSQATYTQILHRVMPRGDQMQIAAIDECIEAKDRAAGFARLADIVTHQREMRTIVLQALAVPMAMLPLGWFVNYTTAKMIVAQERDALGLGPLLA